MLNLQQGIVQESALSVVSELKGVPGLRKTVKGKTPS